MPSLLGAPTTRYRLFVLLLGVFFVYTWNGQRSSFEQELRRRDEENARLRSDRDSVAEKLRVIWLHKKKLESMLNAQKADADKWQSKIKLKESEINGWRVKIEKCSKELSTCEMSPHDIKIKEKGAESELQNCQNKMNVLEGKVKGCSEETNVLKEDLKHCDAKIKQLTGGGAIEHYSQNETAHFSRNHKADEPLSFDRGNIQHHIPNRLLLGKQLAETLEEVKMRKAEEKEQMDKHPQDRDGKDQEVNEQPDKEEQDYKEH